MRVSSSYGMSRVRLMIKNDSLIYLLAFFLSIVDVIDLARIISSLKLE